MFAYMKHVLISKGTVAVIAVFGIVFVLAAQPVSAIEIKFRSFSGAAAIGPPADAYAVKLESITATTLGKKGTVKFTKISPRPGVPKQFKKNIVAAVGAGAAGGGFDAAYVSGSSLNKAWGFIYNSGVPFGPNFDEFLGFLYGKSVDNGRQIGLDLLQSTFDKRKKNIIAIPIVGSSHQGSGYFMKPVGDTKSMSGIGLKGLCQEKWTFRYLPPAQYVLDLTCDNLVKDGVIPKKNISFVTAVAGGKILKEIAAGNVQAFEFATPLDDMSVLFKKPELNPGIVKARYLHYPGWHQPFLVTYMIVNKKVWNKLNEAQKTLVMSVGRDHIASSYGENIRQQGGKLQEVLNANKKDMDKKNDIVLVKWPDKDLKLLKDATIQFLNDRADDQKLKKEDREDYKEILNAFREYVSNNNDYWKVRNVPTTFRFTDWVDKEGKKSWD
jgi:TRAP-type mannitol/chloroaromatic compound transport system substrate-binding protein